MPRQSKYTEEERKERAKAASLRWRERNPEKAKAQTKQWQADNPEKVRAAGKRWAERNPEKIKAKQKLQRARDPEKMREYQRTFLAKHPGYGRALTLKSKYGLTREQYDEMLASQGGCCSICKAGDPLGKGAWHVDHCHDSGAVRGLLCHQCNVGLGHFKDSPTFLAAAIDYLGRHNSDGSQGHSI